MIHVTPWLVALSLKLNAHVHLAPVVLCWCAHAFAVTHCLHVCICLVCVITNGLLCFIVRVMLVLRVSVFVFWLLRLASHLDQFSWQLDNITPTECLQSDSPSPSSLSLFCSLPCVSLSPTLSSISQLRKNNKILLLFSFFFFCAAVVDDVKVKGRKCHKVKVQVPNPPHS